MVSAAVSGPMLQSVWSTGGKTEDNVGSGANCRVTTVHPEGTGGRSSVVSVRLAPVAAEGVGVSSASGAGALSIVALGAAVGSATWATGVIRVGLQAAANNTIRINAKQVLFIFGTRLR